MPKFTVLRGSYTQGGRVFNVGNTIELTEAESVSWGPGRFELAASAPAPAPAPVVDDEDDDSLDD